MDTTLEEEVEISIRGEETSPLLGVIFYQVFTK